MIQSRGNILHNSVCFYNKHIKSIKQFQNIASQVALVSYYTGRKTLQKHKGFGSDCCELCSQACLIFGARVHCICPLIVINHHNYVVFRGIHMYVQTSMDNHFSLPHGLSSYLFHSFSHNFQKPWLIIFMDSVEASFQ